MTATTTTPKAPRSTAAAVALALCTLLLSLPATAAGGSNATNATTTGAKASPATAPTVAEPKTTRTCRNKPWAQCGGREHTGPTCCPPGSGCSHQSVWYSQCVPGFTGAHKATPAHTATPENPTALTIAAAVPEAKRARRTCQNREWSQCGGREYTGATCCPMGSGCAYKNEWYSQCSPGYEMNEDEQGGDQCQPLWYQCGGEQWWG